MSVQESESLRKKVKVIYTSDFTIDETSENVWVDKEAETEDGQVYIVNFL